jgi:hypothetical protein
MKINLFEFNNNVWLFVGAVLACFAVSAGVRYQQFEIWKQTPSAYFVAERPMMTTLDAPLWLRIAREYDEGVYREKDWLQVYPEGTNIFQNSGTPEKFLDTPKKNKHKGELGRHIGTTTEVRYRDVPLLSYLIAHLAPFFNYNFFLAGTLLIPVLASLFIFPLGFYFFRIGVPLSGLLGGLIGTFAGGYYMRSSIGRIDTDMLNLFFPIMAGLLILLAGQGKTERSVLLYSGGAGLSLFFFQWWYDKAGFTLVYFMVLVFYLFVQKVRFRTILLGVFLFILFSKPTIFMNGTGAVDTFMKSYFSIEEAHEVLLDTSNTPASFPNTMTTISEADHVPIEEVFRRVLSNTTLDWVGVLGFFVLAFFKWRVLLPLFPLLALGLLSFQSSNRFIMYLAPFVGVGLGWLLNIGLDGMFYFIAKNKQEQTREYVFGMLRSLDAKTINNDKLSGISLGAQRRTPHQKKNTRIALENKRSPILDEGQNSTPNTIDRTQKDSKAFYYLNWGRQIILFGGMAVFFWLISDQTAISFVPRPSIHPRLYATFLEVKKHVPENAALLTWWDYGYAITDATNLATFHDGGGQRSPKTYFIARGLISNEPEELYDITQYLATEGIRGINKNNTSPKALLEAVRNPKLKPWDPIYLFFTADMTGKYGAISKLGSWDIVNGGTKPRGYQNLSCNKITNEEMNCRGAKFDLKAGKINNQVPLKRIIFIRDGQVLREQKFGHAQGYILQLLVSDQRIVEVQLIDEVVFRSNYNQMFLLGRYDGELFEETYNAFPFSRLYRVKF